jgi:hypothetical protein
MERNSAQQEETPKKRGWPQEELLFGALARIKLQDDPNND